MSKSFMLVVIFTALASFGACSADPGPPGELDIGFRTAEGGFTPWSESQSVALSLGANGLNMIVPSLRAYDINPKSPVPVVEVEIGGVLMAADIKVAGSDADDMTDIGADGFAMWQLSVAFQTNLCCYNCSMAHVTAKITDDSGRVFNGEINVQLARDQCPAPSVCCSSAAECPQPELAQICEE